MFNTIWKVVKWIGRAIKNIITIGFFIIMFMNVSDLCSEVSKMQENQLGAYNTQADVFSAIVKAITATDEYIKKIDDENYLRIKEVDANSLQRDKDVLSLLQDIDNRLKTAEANNRTKVEETKPLTENIDSRPAYEYMKDRIVYLMQQYGDTSHGAIGTGFVVKVDTESTYILTNKHICDWSDNTSCYVMNDKVKYPITLVKENEVDHDIQLVKTDRPIPGKVAVKGIRDVLPQDKVFMVGNNNGNAFMYSEGTVSGFMMKSEDLLVGMPSGPGNSGSAIFTQDGYVAGILFAGQLFELENGSVTMDTAHGICVNSKILRLFLDGYLS